MSVIAIVFVVYLLILAVLALWSRKEAQTMSGYFIAGKKLPPWVVAFSTNATGESGWLLLGLTGMGYAVGVHAYWVVAGEVTGIAAAWILMSRRLKRCPKMIQSPFRMFSLRISRTRIMCFASSVLSSSCPWW